MSVPVQIRSARPKSPLRDDFAQITGRELEWKFSPMAKIGSLIESDLDGSAFPYSISEAPGVTISWIDPSDSRVGSAGIPEDRSSAAAWSATTQVMLIAITGEDTKTVTLTRDSLGEIARAAHIIIEAAEFSQATVVLQNIGDAKLIENVEIIVKPQANLNVISVQEWNESALHLASHFAQVHNDGVLKHSLVSIGGDVIRINPSTHLSGAGSQVTMNGVYFATSGQHIEHQVYVHHDAPHSKSRVTYKGALQGEGARTVWIGDVLIGSKGVGTDSYEQNRNLVLTDGTRADSIPNLEIETGDIVGAGHASATGRFDDEQLFYLQARGISEVEARRLVVQGFLNEIVQQLEVLELEERITEYLRDQLEAGVK
jgi:Fe-S cluster assembly protein SufD